MTIALVRIYVRTGIYPRLIPIPGIILISHINIHNTQYLLRRYFQNCASGKSRHQNHLSQNVRSLFLYQFLGVLHFLAWPYFWVAHFHMHVHIYTRSSKCARKMKFPHRICPSSTVEQFLSQFKTILLVLARDGSNHATIKVGLYLKSLRNREHGNIGI